MLIAMLLPYGVAIAGLILGVSIGYWLRGHKLTSPLIPDVPVPADDQSSARLEQIRALAEDKRKAIQDAEAMITRMETYLSTLNKDIAAAREQTGDKEKERTYLLTATNEQRAPVETTHGAAATLPTTDLPQPLPDHETEALLSGIDRSIEELDMLKELHDTYIVKINRLTQQVQWQDSELRMLQQTIRAKSAEIDEARDLLEQRDSELRRMHRQRQQREIDLSHVRKALNQQSEELQQLLQRQAQQTETLDKPAPSIAAPPAQSIAIPPRKRPSLLSGSVAPSDPVSANGDNLTEIPGLAEFYAAQLRAKGITTFTQLANARPEDIERLLDIPGHFSPDISRWIEAAQKHIDRNGDGLL
jgi:predicted flap endonuclease-1-like 5' DNA nuclease